MAKGHFVVKQFLLLGALNVLVVPASFGDASDFGTTGLIKMPDARMEEDGVLRATIAVDEVANFITLPFKLSRSASNLSVYDIQPNRSSGLSRRPS